MNRLLAFLRSPRRDLGRIDADLVMIALLFIVIVLNACGVFE